MPIRFVEAGQEFVNKVHFFYGRELQCSIQNLLGFYTHSLTL